MIDGKTELLGVFGYPVSHSKSPVMHNALFKELNINAVYVALSPAPEALKNALAGFKALHFRGANITIPYKEKVIPFLDKLSPISEFTGSVNTLYYENGKLCGTTTDPYGALKNLETVCSSLKNKKIAILGNGGAAKAISFALLEKQTELTIVSRNQEKGNALASKLKNIFESEIQVLSFEKFNATPFDIILNTTPVGMHPDIFANPLPNAKFHASQIVYDIIYTPKETALLKQAKAQGATILNGEGMLVYQGLSSFKLWFREETKNLSDEYLATIMKTSLLRNQND